MKKGWPVGNGTQSEKNCGKMQNSFTFPSYQAYDHEAIFKALDKD